MIFPSHPAIVRVGEHKDASILHIALVVEMVQHRSNWRNFLNGWKMDVIANAPLLSADSMIEMQCKMGVCKIPE